MACRKAQPTKSARIRRAIWIGGDNGGLRFGNGRIEQIAGRGFRAAACRRPEMVIALVGPPDSGTPMSSAPHETCRSHKWITEKVMDPTSGGVDVIDQLECSSTPDVWVDGLNCAWIKSLAGILGRRSKSFSIQSRASPMGGRQSGRGDRAGERRSRRQNIYDRGAGRQAPSAEAPSMNHTYEAADGTMALGGPDVLATGRPGSFRLATPANGLVGPEDTLPGQRMDDLSPTDRASVSPHHFASSTGPPAKVCQLPRGR